MCPGWEPRATRRPVASRSPQLKSWDSRTMVEKPVPKDGVLHLADDAVEACAHHLEGDAVERGVGHARMIRGSGVGVCERHPRLRGRGGFGWGERVLRSAGVLVASSSPDSNHLFEQRGLGSEAGFTVPLEEIERLRVKRQ